jgi:hypothetical protein
MLVKSGLQKQVLSLARSLLRAARTQPESSGVAAAIRDQLRRDFLLPRTQTRVIEHLLRRGERKLELLKGGSVTAVRTTTI